LSRKRTAALGAGALSALLAGGIALAPMASAEVEDSAYAIAADGLINIPKLPDVVGSGDDSVVSADLPPEGEAVLSLGVLNASAGEGWSRASTADLELGLAGAPVIKASLLEVNCDDLKASTKIVGLKVDGEERAPENQVPANTEIVPEQLGQVAKVTLNKQVENEDGSLTVTAVSVDLLDSTQTIDISSATCTDGGDGGEPTEPTKPTDPTEPSEPGDGDNGDNRDDDGDGDGDEADENGNAPVPTPQPGHLDVTG
jgi:hypothetical protein